MRIRTIIITARFRPASVIVIFQKWTRVSPSWVKNRLRMPVKIRMNTSGFMPRRIALGEIRESFTAPARKPNRIR